MKLGVIGGAGVVGSAVAFYAAANALVDEIILYDVKANFAANHAMDIDQGTCLISPTKTCSAEFEALAECDIIVNAAGVPEIGATSRDVYVEGNTKILVELAEKMRAWPTGQIIISATNPIDVLNYRFSEMLPGPKKRFIGFSSNDSLRFKWAISIETGIETMQIDAYVLGEHGQSQVPIFSRISRKDTGLPISLSPAQSASVLDRVDSWFGLITGLQAPRTMGWTSGVGIGQIIAAVVGKSNDVLRCSVIPDNQYGISGISIGLPVRLGPTGVEEIIEIPLDESEKLKLAESVETIRKKTQA